MKLKRNIAISESGFVFNPTNGDTYSINPIGQEIVEMLKEGKDFQAIKAGIIAAYQTEPATFERDFEDFMQMLHSLKLMEEAA